MADLHITKKSKYTEEELKIIKDNYPHNLDLIVELLPLRNRKSIIVKACNMGLSSGKIKVWTKEEDEIIKKYYASNGSEYLANNFLVNRDYKSIQRRAFNLGIKYLNYNTEYFERINSHEKAYWIGFLMADGYVNKNDNRFGMELQLSDISHIEKFLICIEGNQKIRTRKRNRLENELVTNPTESCSVLINNKKMHDNLIEAGVIPNKSLLVKLPNKKFVDDYFFDILRGLIDGDGSIGLYNTSNGYKKPHISLVSGSKDLLADIKNRLEIYDIDIKLDKVGNNLYRIMTEKQSSCFTLLKNLYKNSTVNSKLERKYTNALEISDYYSQHSLV